MPPAETGGSEAVWKILAEVTRENNQRDVKITEISGKLDAIGQIRDQLEKHDRRAQSLDDALRDVLVHLRDLDAAKVTDGEQRVLRRLDDLLKTRGSLELLTNGEVETVRELIRTRREYDSLIVSKEKRIRSLETWRDAHEGITEQRAELIHVVEGRVAELEQWQRTMRDIADSQATRLYEVEWKAFKREEVEQVRFMLQQWQDFFTKYLDTVKQLVSWWTNRANRHENVQTFLATKKREVLMTLAFIVPFTVLLTALANWFLTHH